MTGIRVVIADDHPILRDGVATALAAHDNIETVAAVATFAQVVDVLAAATVDVVILDLNGMQGSPFVFVERVRREHPSVGLLVFSSTVDLAPELLAAGVQGYVAKEELSQHLVQAVEVVAQNGLYLSPLVTEYVDRAKNARHGRRLAPKELSTVKLVAQGLETEEIAAQMRIDPRSVQNYVGSAMRKIGCANRVQLTDWYRRVYGNEPM
jgi:DNA-binding NarL/FixJ family response regulator